MIFEYDYYVEQDKPTHIVRLDLIVGMGQAWFLEIRYTFFVCWAPESLSTTMGLTIIEVVGAPWFAYQRIWIIILMTAR
jgi:hypothetical protein